MRKETHTHRDPGLGVRRQPKISTNARTSIGGSASPDGPLTSADIIHFQTTIGNRAVRRRLSRDVSKLRRKPDRPGPKATAGPAPAPAETKKCEEQSLPVRFGNLTLAADDVATHIAGMDALTSALNKSVDLYIEVMAASMSERATFDEKKKKIAQSIKEKESVVNNLGSIAVKMVATGAAMYKGFAAARELIRMAKNVGDQRAELTEAVTNVLTGGGDIKSILVEEASELRLMEESFTALTDFATKIRGHQAEHIELFGEVIDIILRTNMSFVRNRMDFIASQIERSMSCGALYDAKDLAGLEAKYERYGNQSYALATRLKGVQALWAGAVDPDALQWLKKGTEKRKKYDRLVELVLARDERVQLIYWVDRAEHYLLMTDDVRSRKELGIDFARNGMGFGKFDHKSGTIKGFWIEPLRGAVETLVMALREDKLDLLKPRKREGDPRWHWEDLPGVHGPPKFRRFP